MRGKKPTIPEKPKSIGLAMKNILKNKEKVQIQEPTAHKAEDTRHPLIPTKSLKRESKLMPNAHLHLIEFRKGDFHRMKILLI